MPGIPLPVLEMTAAPATGAAVGPPAAASPAGGAPPHPAVTTAAECAIPGLQLYLEFVTEEDQATLLHATDSRPWTSLSRRKVQHYGTPFSYLTRSVDADAPVEAIPAAMQPLLDRMQSLPGVGPLDQLTVNEYSPGVGLSPHIDTHSAFGPALVSLSLAGPAVMELRREGRRAALLLPPRSLVVLTGEARHAWAHYIPHRKSDPLSSGEVVARAARRVSLTFRLVREGPCRCDWPQECDSQDGFIPPTRMALKGAAEAAATAGGGNGQQQERPGGDSDVAAACSGPGEQHLEQQNVVDVYNAIAPHFSATRFAVWPKVRAFIESLPPGALVADVGCGNGKYFGLRPDIFVSGSDRSQGLAQVAARRLHPSASSAPAPFADVAVADALHLPYRPGSCDAAVCIAVLHHIGTVERRLALLRQLAALLAPGGRALVTVWATEQEGMEKKLAKWQPLGKGEDTPSLMETVGDGRRPVESAGTPTQLPEDVAAAPAAASMDFLDPSQDYLVPWHLPRHRADAAAAACSAAEVDNIKNTLVFKRYYHLFRPGELEGLVAGVAGCSVVQAFYDKDNWCVVFETVPLSGGGGQ